MTGALPSDFSRLTRRDHEEQLVRWAQNHECRCHPISDATSFLCMSLLVAIDRVSATRAGVGFLCFDHPGVVASLNPPANYWKPSGFQLPPMNYAGE